MSARRLAVVGLVGFVLVALSAAAASAVRATRGPASGPIPVTPGASATAPSAPIEPGLAPRPPEAPAAATTSTPTARSRAVGRPNRGRLENGVLLPPEGPDHATWDAVDLVAPNRDWRRVGTDRLVATILRVSAAYRRVEPGAPRVVVSDLSLPQGGPFGPGYGGLGHASHQNGLDVDIAYPRRDGREVGVDRWSQADRRRSQALVDAFVRAGARFVFVGPRTKLRGPKGVVEAIPSHDDHLHVRLPG